MRAHVINLPRSVERRAHVERQLAATGLEHEFVDAVDGRDLERGDPRVDWAAVAGAPGWLTGTMLGCSLSHLEAAGRIVAAADGPALVLEDDVVLPDRFAELAGRVGERLTGASAALLYFRAFGDPEMASGERAGTVELRVPLNPRALVCSAAYVVTPAAAARMVERLLPVALGPDSWGAFLERGVLDELVCAYPRPVAVRHDFKSTLGLAPWFSVLVPARLRERRRARIEAAMSQF